MITATSSPQAYAYWEILTGLIPEAIITFVIPMLAIGIAIVFMRKMAFYDRI